jgi:SAM-dependent methyltransferase
MSRTYAAARRVVPAAVRRRARGLLPPDDRVADALIERSARFNPELAPLYDLISDDEARLHFGEHEPLEARHHRSGIRLFHAWKVKTMRAQLGTTLEDAVVLDVGDTDGLLLRDLGKRGIGFNLSDAAIRNITANGIEAVQGDAHSLPFPAGSFDVVLCFETLEHVESQHAVLLELARVCRPGGRCFVSIPWVPRTVVHPIASDGERGQQHVFELSRDDFAALVTHTPFRLVYEDVCRLFAQPRGPVERLYLWRHRKEHIVTGSFRAFQFFELERLDDA